MIDALPLLLSDEGYQISRSVRLRSSASAYFSRTPASAGNRKTFTISYWIKRGALTGTQYLFSAGSGTTEATWFSAGAFDTETISVGTWTTTGGITTAVFRDPSAWYHVVISVDTTQATAANRCRIFVNGVQQATSTPTLTLNADLAWNNSGVVHYIGARIDGGPRMFFDGYITEINSIDGQALTPSSFGETNSVTGVWQPKRYTGTYGTNGFYLNFSDPSAATAAAIGKDYSGNGNNWTPNNISVTAGATYDSMLDVPTPWGDGGNGRGNYCTLNPLDFGILGGGSFVAPTNGNLDWTGNAGGDANIKATIAVSTGKWYAEFSNLASAAIPCVVTVTTSNTANSFPNQAGGYGYLATGQKANNAVYSAYGATYTSSDVIGIALDLDAGTVTFYKNNVSQGQAFSGLSGTFTFGISDTTFAAITANVNFGQRPFAYTPPSGFRALNTQNLPTPTIAKGNLYFDATTYAGTNSTLAVTNSGGFQPDLVWIKNRSLVTAHMLQDAVRGATAYISSNSTAAENTNTANNWFRSFDASGFTVSNLTTGGTNTTEWNNSGYNYVGWQWKEGATQGFDIVTYTGNSTASRSVSHSLGVTPSMIFVKNRTTAQNNPVAHTSLAVGNLLLFDTTGASAAAGTRLRLGNSTTFTVGDAADYTITNQTGNNYVAYLFAEVAGFSRFGSYTGNGSADGPMVFTGFSPRFVMIKNASAVAGWVIYDSSRRPYNLNDLELYPNFTNADSTGSNGIDFLSNGFKIRGSVAYSNGSGNTIIYAAFAEHPFKNALAR